MLCSILAVLSYSITSNLKRCMTCALFVYVLYTFPVNFLCRICARFVLCTFSVHNSEMYLNNKCPTILGVRFVYDSLVLCTTHSVHVSCTFAIVHIFVHVYIGNFS